MKALMGEIAKEIRNDPVGKESLNQFMKGGQDSMKIFLTNGRIYTITRGRGNDHILTESQEPQNSLGMLTSEEIEKLRESKKAISEFVKNRLAILRGIL